jgi:hypothetical protein
MATLLVPRQETTAQNRQKSFQMFAAYCKGTVHVEKSTCVNRITQNQYHPYSKPPLTLK